MGFSELEKQRINKIIGDYCERKIPVHLRNQVKLFYKIRGYDVKIIESRPHFIHKSEWTEHPIARLKYDPDERQWLLYWQRASGRWEKYSDFKPTKDLSRIIDEIDKDQWHVFWG